ncbi:MAG: hypothetical protein H7A34_07515, partial [bacterium]|nr:hypothetical protein [bacterium]
SLQHAFLYENNTMYDLGTLGGTSSLARSINDEGNIVGWAHTASQDQHAFLYQDGAMYDLNDFIDPELDFTLYFAYDINEQGDIVGWGTNTNGDIRGFVLYNNETAPAVPEPATVILLLCAFISLYGKKTTN